MEFDECLDLCDVLRAGDRHCDDHFRVHTRVELSIDVVDVGGSTGHACAEVFAGLAKDGHGAVRHVFATVITNAFDDGGGSRITDCKALTGAAIGEEVSASGSVKAGITSNGVLRSVELCVR